MDKDEDKKDKPKKGKKDDGTVNNQIIINPEINDSQNDDSVQEELETLDELLSLTGRRRQAIKMRRYKSKLSAARRRRKHIRADKKRLARRSHKKAIQVIRKRIAGQKGSNYRNLSSSEKAQIDRRVERRKAAIDRLSRRLLPKVRKADMERIREENDETINPFAEKIKKRVFHTMRHKDGRMKFDKRFKMFKNAPATKDMAAEEITTLDLVKAVCETVAYDDSKIAKSLRKKAETHNESYELLRDIYDRGVAMWAESATESRTPSQYGMDRVSSYLSRGEAYRLDEDLSEAYYKSDNERKIDAAMKLMDKMVKTEKHKTIGTIAFDVVNQYNIGMSPRQLEKKYREEHGMKQAGMYSEEKKCNKEEGGAGDEGTDKLTKKYKNDTPYQEVDESFENYLAELKKPTQLKSFRQHVKDVTKVDARSKDWADTLPDLMAQHGFKLLGAGKYASVFGNPKYPYVIKVFMKDSAYLKWIQFALKNRNNPYVPKVKGKVVKISPVIYAIRLEKLEPGSLSGPFAEAYSKWRRDPNFKSDDKNIQDILDYFAKYKDLLDLHGENVMMRGNQLVVIDPFYNWFNKKNYMDYTLDPNDIDPSLF